MPRTVLHKVQGAGEKAPVCLMLTYLGTTNLNLVQYAAHTTLYDPVATPERYTCLTKMTSSFSINVL